MKIRGNTVGTTVKPERVLVKATDLTEEQKAQARENIGAEVYYHTKREELGVSHGSINDAYIFGLYDALAEKYNTYKKKEDGTYELDEDGNKIPLCVRVQKKEHTNDDETFTNYEYVISTGEYSTDGMYAKDVYSPDPHTKKPKYLILSGIHGSERQAALSTYWFIRDVLRGHNIPQVFREGAIISVMPVGDRSAFNAYQRQNDKGVDSEGVVIKGVDINRNFDWNWVADERTDENGNEFTYGDPAGSEKETQAIAHWLAENTDAELFIDHHNSGRLNEKVVVMGMSDDTDAELARKIALRGVDRIIPFWKEVIDYHDTAVTMGGVERDVIYSYSATLDSSESSGMAFAYAHNVLGIRSIAIETCHYYGDYDEYQNHEANLKNNPSETYYQPEVIAMGAEALGNILIEFYTQSCEVMMMSKISNDMENLLKQVNSGFHTESGTLKVTADSGSATAPYLLKIPCTSGAKTVIIQADDETLAKITGTTKDATHLWFVGAMGNCIAKVGNREHRAFVAQMDIAVAGGVEYWRVCDRATTCNNTERYDENGNRYGYSFNTAGIKEGSYNWTAYYWND